ncbi:hypothetical protein ES703_43299 [subsurface metagenome]
MELTVKQAIYSLLSASLLDGTPLHHYGTTRAIVKGLDKVYGVKISRGYASQIIGEIAKECYLSEYTGQRKTFLPVYAPSEKVYKLGEPGNILRVRKWKRDGSRRQDSQAMSQDKANPS